MECNIGNDVAGRGCHVAVGEEGHSMTALADGDDSGLAISLIHFSEREIKLS